MFCAAPWCAGEAMSQPYPVENLPRSKQAVFGFRHSVFIPVFDLRSFQFWAIEAFAEKAILRIHPNVGPSLV
jgi:hypothetical protein